MMKIYVIEDEKTIREELVKLLKTCGYESVAYEGDYEDVVKETLLADADLILLDINLPFLDGYHVCREIRKQSDVPVIIVTSRSSDMDELMGIQLGADDFITKPYNRQILLARIESLLKRTKKDVNADTMEYRGLKISLAKSTVAYGTVWEELTRNELRILTTLIKKAGCIVSRDELMEELWQSDEFVDDNTLTVNVNRLRHKLENMGAGDVITTKRGQGYRI